MKINNQSLESNIPLFVDLDGTLLRSDMIWEAVIQLLRSHPLKLLKCLFGILLSRAYFKELLANATQIDASILPYNDEVLQKIEEVRSEKCKVYLVTATHYSLAQLIADYLGIFDGVFGSTQKINLKGAKKLQKIHEIVGKNDFDYIGNSISDLPIWNESRRILVIRPSKALEKKLSTKSNVEILTLRPTLYSSIFDWLRTIRIYHWPKNMLLAVPILLAPQIFNKPLWIHTFFAILSFSFCASAVYILNNLVDLDADRHHPTKKNRTFASGRISIAQGFFFWPLLFILSIAISLKFAIPNFHVFIVVYFIFANLYSWIFKTIFLVDVMVLAGLYTMRIVAGAFNNEVTVSLWLLWFSWFFFLSLSFMKRYADLSLIRENKKVLIKRRGYKVDHINFVKFGGVISGLLSVAIFVFYINSDYAVALYSNPLLLFVAILSFTSWLTRMWQITLKGQMHQDPLISALKDPWSYILFILLVSVFFLARTL